MCADDVHVQMCNLFLIHGTSMETHREYFVFKYLAILDYYYYYTLLLLLLYTITTTTTTTTTTTINNNNICRQTTVQYPLHM